MNRSMPLVNQSYRLIAILLQSTLYKTKIEDLVTIRNRLFYLYPWIPYLYLFNWKYGSNLKNYVSQFHNPNFQFRIVTLGYKSRE